MKLPVLTSVIIFIIVMQIVSKRNERRINRSKDSFWERERKANSVRRQSLDALDYIIIPYDTLPMDVDCDDEVLANCQKELKELSGDTIVNFTGYTNTDLKLMYGAPNITKLTQYDQNFTALVRALQNYAKRLSELGYTDEALTVLDFAIAIRSDVSASYYLAAKLYFDKGNFEKISYLKRTASTLRSAMKDPIVRTLQESYPDID